MLDKNGTEIRMGDIVRVSGGYFKTSNGTFYVSNSDTERTLWLHRLKKNGEICLPGASSTQNWPLTSYCSDRTKNALAKKHNKEHAQIEVVNDVNTWHVAEHFWEEAKKMRKAAEDIRLRNDGRGDADACEAHANEYAAVAERLSDGATAPQEKRPEHGVKFYWNGIKVDGGRLIPCYFWLDENRVMISAKDYKDLPREYFPVENNSDSYTDYFESDHATLTPEHPLYKFARFVALKGIANGKSYRKMTDEQAAEWGRMKDPGQPTAADIQAVEDMKLAAENARKAKERAEELERREQALKARAEGQHYIESVMEQHPIEDGAPVVTIRWSEHPAFYHWHDGELKMSIAAAEIILKHFDEQVHAKNCGYDKTSFLIRWNDEATGEENEYEGRYDLGDNDGGLIEHIRLFGRYQQEHGGGDETMKVADYFERFTEGGRIEQIDLAPGVLDFLEIRRKKQEEEAKEKMDEIRAMVQMLTDEQLIACIFKVDPKDAGKLDIARFFMQELYRRDEGKAVQVWTKWMTGA